MLHLNPNGTLDLNIKSLYAKSQSELAHFDIMPVMEFCFKIFG